MSRRMFVSRVRVFVVGPGLFVSLSVFVVSFRSFVVDGWWLDGLNAGWLDGFGRRAVLLVPVVTAPDE